MKKILVLLIACLMAGPILAQEDAEKDPQAEKKAEEKSSLKKESVILSLQGEVLALAKERHAVIGDNLKVREDMLAAQKQEGSADAKSKMKSLREAMKANNLKIRELSRQIRSKRAAMVSELRALRQKAGRNRDIRVPEDVSNVD